MNKLAIFVEGQTESLFVSKLIEEIANSHQVIIERKKASGGRRRPRIHQLVYRTEDRGQKFYILIVDCSTDNRVATDIRDNYARMAKEGYQKIIGIKDVFPDFSYDEIPRHRRGLMSIVDTEPIQVTFILGVMEIETWFIAEHTHFERINPQITLQRIIDLYRFDPSTDDIQLRDHPADDLHKIYQIAGEEYTKRKENAQRTVNALDYERLYLELKDRIPDLKNLLDCLDGFLSCKNHE